MQPRCALKASFGTKVKSRPSQIPPWEYWHSVKYARHSDKQGPRHVTSFTQDEVPPIVTPPYGAVPVLGTDLSEIKLLSTISRKDTLKHMHHHDTTFPEVQPCDTPTGLDKKTYYSAEEPHCATGCQKFKKYDHLVAGTQDSHYVDRDEFLLSLGSYSAKSSALHPTPLEPRRY